ncbi:MAG: helix-turn-helix domain-containing protein [Bacteroidales bacterium]|nr:helix-turn-helix domain-containing protein [Bacteroidales bacterium]
MDAIALNDIGSLIRQLRERKGWTQQQLADTLWVSRQTISGWENGKDMSFVDAVSVLRILGARVIIKLPDKEG